MEIVFNLKQAQDLVSFFGGEDAEVAVLEGDDSHHSGPGLYAYFIDCPDEGAIFLGDDCPTNQVNAAEAEQSLCTCDDVYTIPGGCHCGRG